MRILGASIEETHFDLKVPFVTALRRVDRIHALHVTVLSDDGTSGLGAATPTAPITGDTASSIREAVSIIGEKLASSEDEGLNFLTDATAKALVGNTSAKAAVDMALYNLFARRAGLPLYAFLGGSKRALSTDLTISLRDPVSMADDAKRAERNGMAALKVKLGGAIDEDFKRISAIRSAVSCALRVDANQGWTVRDALRFMDKCATAGLEIDFLEQPVSRADFRGMRYIKERISCPLVADECVFSPHDALRVAETRAADIVNVKLMKCGGIAPALKIAAIAETCGLDLMFGCMAESPVGIAAVVHLASALPKVRYLDLDVPFLLKTISDDFGFNVAGTTLSPKESAGF